MITLRNVSKSYDTNSGQVSVLKNISLDIKKGERIGIFGPNGTGKSTLIRLISGVERPDSGEIHRSMTVSWPLAFTGGFQSALTGYDNFRFICRIYGYNPEEKIGFIEDFSELGIYLKEPIRKYSSGMRARLAFAISMAIEFDCYLIDEVIAVGDIRFRDKCRHELFQNRRDRAIILVSHNVEYMRVYCNRGLVLQNGCLYDCESVEEAFQIYAK